LPVSENGRAGSPGTAGLPVHVAASALLPAKTVELADERPVNEKLPLAALPRKSQTLAYVKYA